MARRVVAARVRFVRYPPSARGGDAPAPATPIVSVPADRGESALSPDPPVGALVLPGDAWLVLPGDATLALPG